MNLQRLSESIRLIEYACFYVYVSIRLIEYTCFYVYVSIRLIEYTCFYVHVSIRLIEYTCFSLCIQNEVPGLRIGVIMHTK